MGLRLAGIWAFNLDFQLAWCWDHLLDLHLDIKITYCFAWHLKIPLPREKNFWLEFYLAS